jgi:hypothetical protein
MGEGRWIDEIRERAERQEYDCEDVPALLEYVLVLEQKNELSQRTIDTLLARLQVSAGGCRGPRPGTEGPHAGARGLKERSWWQHVISR